MTVPGNPEVIALLELYLETARNNDFGHVAISMVGYPNVGATDYAGDIALEEGQLEALQTLTGKVKASIDNWTPPDAEGRADYACYNMANGPLGFDFLVWLVASEMGRRRERAPDPLKVGFWLGRDADDRINRDQRRTWLNNVFRPSLKLLGAVEDDAAITLGRHSKTYVLRPISDASRNGENVPRFTSRFADRVEPGAVVITLREATHQIHRNSNLHAWLRFASDLRAAGERVVFVRDTARASEPLGDFETDPLAALDLEYRMARYETAKMNYFVGNGPVTLAEFSAAPYRTFQPIIPESKFPPDTPSFWRESQGIAPGGQFPWAHEDQRIVWGSDTYENIRADWER